MKTKELEDVKIKLTGRIRIDGLGHVIDLISDNILNKVCDNVCNNVFTNTEDVERIVLSD